MLTRLQITTRTKTTLSVTSINLKCGLFVSEANASLLPPIVCELTVVWTEASADEMEVWFFSF